MLLGFLALLLLVFWLWGLVTTSAEERRLRSRNFWLTRIDRENGYDD